ncbi:Uncharacterised protein [Streptococcus agalactiae]|nr:Uncharacterised protein [Streptococcus agalactiae]
MFYWELFKAILFVIMLVVNLFTIRKLLREYKYSPAIINYWKNR